MTREYKFFAIHSYLKTNNLSGLNDIVAAISGLGDNFERANSGMTISINALELSGSNIIVETGPEVYISFIMPVRRFSLLITRSGLNIIICSLLIPKVIDEPMRG